MATGNLFFDYDQQEHQYASYRKTDPRIASYVHDALAGAGTVLNVGAGAGSYEPDDKYVVAVEPSAVMRKQRILSGKKPALNGTAENLPFDDKAFDASMAMVTVHHWPDLYKGLKELRRVTRQQVVVMIFDPEALHTFWNIGYFPELVEVEKKRYPSISKIVDALGGKTEVVKIPISLDCTDGFQEAYYGRPEAFLQKEVRQAQSAWGFLSPDLEAELVQRLANALQSGEWDRKHGRYRNLPECTFALRLIIAKP